jgi:hypothetical protein
MPELAVIVNTGGGVELSPLIAGAGEWAAWRFLEFFTVNTRNQYTRVAYAHAAGAFQRWCAEQGLGELGRVQTVHVAAYIETLLGGAFSAHREAASRRHPDAVRLVTGQVAPSNPAHSVRGPRYSVSKESTSGSAGWVRNRGLRYCSWCRAQSMPRARRSEIRRASSRRNRDGRTLGLIRYDFRCKRIVARFSIASDWACMKSRASLDIHSSAPPLRRSSSGTWNASSVMPMFSTSIPLTCWAQFVIASRTPTTIGLFAHKPPSRYTRPSPMS